MISYDSLVKMWSLLYALLNKQNPIYLFFYSYWIDDNAILDFCLF